MLKCLPQKNVWMAFSSCEIIFEKCIKQHTDAIGHPSIESFVSYLHFKIKFLLVTST